MAASARHRRRVQASARGVLTWVYRHVYIGKLGADSHEFARDVDREETIQRFRQDVGESPLLSAQLSDFAG